MSLLSGAGFILLRPLLRGVLKGIRSVVSDVVENNSDEVIKAKVIEYLKGVPEGLFGKWARQVLKQIDAGVEKF